ncbi:cytochrome P450, partial [Kibdelosporangium lantanae]
PEETRPVVYNSWEATEFDVSEDNQKRLAALAADLGCELFVMDDGWFGARTHDAAGLGDWTPNPSRFPGGLNPLIAEVHRLGMRFGLWVEPEMVNPDSDLYRQHPDWVMHMPNRSRTEMRNQLVLNFARTDVAEWAHKWLDQLVGQHEIDFLKWDMNRSFSEAGWPSLIPTAVEEMIRYDAPLQLFERTAVADVTVAGYPVKAGEKIAALLGAAARDPEVFDQPDVFDAGRDPNPHLGFGAGIHYCVGAPLARVEITAALTALVRRFTTGRVADQRIQGSSKVRPNGARHAATRMDRREGVARGEWRWVPDQSGRRPSDGQGVP